jgi:2-keto-3-deoxy-L-rhamnonate aldolase RhmA
MEAPELLSAIDRIIISCKNVGMPVSLMVHSNTQTTTYHKKGVHVFIHAVESFKIKDFFIGMLNNLNTGL